ncbi:hypothetical protein TNCV_5057271 [Trichonephila clavipes]|nr:hypothetical protein TNCV_5057271 [Trichonephila clavipes]
MELGSRQRMLVADLQSLTIRNAWELEGCPPRGVKESVRKATRILGGKQKRLQRQPQVIKEVRGPLQNRVMEAVGKSHQILSLDDTSKRGCGNSSTREMII